MIESVSHDLFPLLEKDKSVRIIGTRQQPVRLPHELAAAAIQQCKVRQAAFMALQQQDFLEAVVGDPRIGASARPSSPAARRWRRRPAWTAYSRATPRRPGDAAGGRLRRHAHRVAAIFRSGRAHEPGTRGQGTARACRLQSRHADHGLAKPGQPVDHQERAAIGRRLERLCDQLGAARHSRSADDAVSRRNLREGPRRLAVRPGMEKVRDDYARATGVAEKRRIAEEAQIYNTRS